MYPNVQQLTNDDYELLAQMLDQLTDRVGEDETHPLAPLMDIIGKFVDDYESELELANPEEIEAVYAEYAAGDYITFEEFMRQRKQS